MTGEAIAAAQAELDQATAAVAELQGEHDEAKDALDAMNAEYVETVAAYKAKLRPLGEVFEPLALELERRQGEVRRAEARLAAAQAGEPYEPGPDITFEGKE